MYQKIKEKVFVGLLVLALLISISVVVEANNAETIGRLNNEITAIHQIQEAGEIQNQLADVEARVRAIISELNSIPADQREGFNVDGLTSARVIVVNNMVHHLHLTAGSMDLATFEEALDSILSLVDEDVVEHPAFGGESLGVLEVHLQNLIRHTINTIIDTFAGVGDFERTREAVDARMQDMDKINVLMDRLSDDTGINTDGLNAGMARLVNTMFAIALTIEDPELLQAWYDEIEMFIGDNYDLLVDFGMHGDSHFEALRERIEYYSNIDDETDETETETNNPQTSVPGIMMYGVLASSSLAGALMLNKMKRK